MSLLRMAGLIALSVAATTLQASPRLAPVARANPPASQDSPARNSPRLKATQQYDKRELVLVIAPHSSAWSDAATRCSLDGAGSEPASQPVLASACLAVDRPSETGRISAIEIPRSFSRVARSWLASHYPHAPPACL